MPLSPGTRIGQYEVIRPIGAGGMGEVYLGRDTRLNRDVALKTLLQNAVLDSELVVRFEREAQTLAALNHPNIAHIYGIEEIEGGYMIVMELVAGPTLADRIDHGPVSMDEAMPIAAQLLGALEYAHAQNVIHRDLKPANIKLRPDGVVKVLDFGLAKQGNAETGKDTDKLGLTATGQVFGTPGYMAPELLRGGAADVRTDIFALGIVLFELVTGKHPFRRGSIFEIAEAILNPAPPSWPDSAGHVPDVVQFVIRKALAKDPRARYQSVYELRSDLSLSSGIRPATMSIPSVAPASAPNISSGEHERFGTLQMSASGALSPDSAPIQATIPIAPPRPARSRRLLTIAAAILSGVIVAGAGFALWRWMQNNTSGPRVDAQHTQVTFVGNVRGVAFSPDGRTAAYLTQSTTSDGRVLIRDVEGGQALEIWRGQIVVEVQWMPNGSQLLVSGIQNNALGVWLVPRLGGTARRLPGRGGAHLAVSPDGQYVAMAFENQVRDPQSRTPGFRIVPVGVGEERFVEMKGVRWFKGLDWGGSNNRIAVLTSTDDLTASIWSVSPDGSDIRRIHTERADITSVRWSPLSDAVYVIRSSHDSGEVLRIADRGGNQNNVTTLLSGLPYDATNPYSRQSSLSTDGRRLLYIRSFTYSNLWRMNATAASDLQSITNGTSRYGAPHLSPDGQWIASSLGTSALASIVKIPIGGGEPTQITSGQALDKSPVWSPDGSRLAFVSIRDNVPRVWTVDADGRSSVEVPSGQAEALINMALDWLPDGRLIWLAPGGRDYRITDVTSGRQENVITDTVVGMPGDARVSPSGSDIAIWWNRTDVKTSGLWTIGWPDRTPRLVKPGPYRPSAWSPDGRYIYVYEWGGQTVARVTAATGEMQTIGKFPVGTLEGCSVTRDGQAVVCSLRETKSDAWLVEHFDPDAPPISK